MTITLSDSGFEARISTLGAELVSLQDEQGRDLLWDGDPAFWGGRSPLLFPIVGRLKGDALCVDGARYTLPQHGFARTSQFDVTDASPSVCHLRLGSTPSTRDHYPFDFKLDVTYQVRNSTLVASATVLNAGQSAMPVSFGFHPALRWPLPYGGGREAHEIRFENPEPEPIRRLVDGLLGRTAQPSPVDGNRLVLRNELFEAGALVFDRIRSRSVLYGVPGRPAIRLSFPGMPHLGLWTKPGAGFVCIEPWQGYASPEGFDGELTDKPGVVLIPPGDTARFAMEISMTGR